MTTRHSPSQAASARAPGSTLHARAPAGPAAGRLTIASHPWRSWPELASQWTELAHATPAAAYFLSESWVRLWLQHYAEELAPRVLVFHDAQRGADSVIAMCLIAFRAERRGPVTIRRVYLNTAGEDEADEALAEHNSILCRDGRELEVAQALREYLDGEQWDEFVAPALASGPVFDALRATFQAHGVGLRTTPSPYVDLAALRAAGESFLQSLSSNTRQQIRRSMRLYAGDGPIVVDVAGTESEAQSMLDELAGLHERSWRARGQHGVFASLRFCAFHRQLIAATFADGVPLLLRVRAGEAVIGLLYGFVQSGRFHFYQSGFTTGADNRHKPGLVTHAAAIDHCLTAGLAEYDFLAGDSQYKRSLATHSRPLTWVVVRRDNLKNQAIGVLRQVRRACRRLLHARPWSDRLGLRLAMWVPMASAGFAPIAG